MKQNRNRCGRFNINAVTNDAPNPWVPLFASVCVCGFLCVCVHCGHYNEIRLQFKRHAYFLWPYTYLEPRLLVHVLLVVVFMLWSFPFLLQLVVAVVWPLRSLSSQCPQMLIIAMVIC